MEKVFAYIRVSSQAQAKTDKDGFERQKQAIEKYATANNLQIVEHFYEDHTGTDQHRPELARLMVSLEEEGQEVKTVLIEKLDRLARELMIQEAIIKDFVKNDFNIISAIEGKDLSADDATRKLVRQVMGAFSEYEKTMLVAKLWAAKERKRIKTGKYAGGRMNYNESEKGREIIRLIRKLRRRKNGSRQWTWQQIADYLNENNIFTLNGQKWSLHNVFHVSRQKLSKVTD